MLAIEDPDWPLYVKNLRSREGVHSALDEVKILQTLCSMKSEEMLQNPYEYTFIVIISYLNAKVPIPLQRVYGLANRCASHAELEYILYGYARPKTALNMKHLFLKQYT